MVITPSISTAEVAALTNIRHVTRRILDHLGPNVGRREPTTSTLRAKANSDFTLPPLQPITTNLLNIGLPSSAAETVSDNFLKHASRLKVTFEHNARATLQAWSEAEWDQHTQQEIYSIRSAYTARYERLLSQWTELSLNNARLFLDRTRDITPVERTEHLHNPFKQLSTLQLLETAFSVNAYPSREEKEQLAQQASLGSKQVNDWFQNRRNKCRRTGKTLSRMERLSPPQNCETGIDMKSGDADCVLRPKDTRDPFLIQPPSYAFPSKFRQGCFSRSSHFELPWPRLAGAAGLRSPLEHSSPDVSALMGAMAQLRLGADPARPVSISSSAMGRRGGYPGVTVVPAHAPLPALIRYSPAAGERSLWSIDVPRTKASFADRSPETQTLSRTYASTSKPSTMPPSSVHRVRSLVREHAHPYHGPPPRVSPRGHARLIRRSSDESLLSTSSACSSDDSPPLTPPAPSAFELPYTKSVSSLYGPFVQGVDDDAVQPWLQSARP